MGISRLLTNLKKDKMLRRNRIGTRSADLWAWEIEDFSNMQGPLAVQEYIQELIRNDPSNVKKIVEPPPDVDVNVWQYEHLRQFILELNLLVTQLKGVCTPASCPTMKATEDWLYRCAVHKSPQECSAIDYMIHNLDQATSILQNVKIYSSRVSIPPSAVKNLGPIVRRLYRLFSHTYFNHKEIFMEFEREMYLCARFTEYSLRFDMMAPKLMIVPKESLRQQYLCLWFGLRFIRDFQTRIQFKFEVWFVRFCSNFSMF
eukprot:TRINITY_DN2223_c0_g1_i1.p1 TRINITY_DN2223_c0_g1~~TRINITY_DN2223_c0_g1_i1.p1  ORF type:complete len:259 (-),score=17.54 TRINITY_DN2223_c0_g1_i1:128-904(-)